MTTLAASRYTDVASEALRLADEGLAVFMLSRTKRPVANCPACRDAGDDHDREACPHLLCHGFYAASRNPDRIRQMIQAVPGGMLAVRTGRRAGDPFGVVVVDIDPGNGGNVDQLIRRHHLPRSAYVQTGSGPGSLHIYYGHPGVPVPNSAGRLSLGVDVRGDGGYVVAPPSIHPRTGRPYVWVQRAPVEEMPPALVTACLPPPAAPITIGARPTTTAAGDIAHPDRLLAAHLAAIERAAPGTRRVKLFGAAHGVARMVAVGAISVDDATNALTEAGRNAQQTERDIRRAIEGGFRAEGVAL